MIGLADHPALRRDIRLLIAARFAHSSIFIIPVLVPYYQHQIGLSFQELLIGEAAFAATIVLMEVPSGWLADTLGRKRCLVLGFLLNAFCYLILWQASGFWGAVGAQAAIGVGISLISGADVALFYDRLAAAGQTSEFRRLEGLRHGLSQFGIALASVAGGLLYAWRPDLPILATVVAELTACAATLAVYEPPRSNGPRPRNPLTDIILTARKSFRERPELPYLYLFAAATFGATINGFWSQQPYYQLLEIPVAQFGLLAAIGFTASGLGGTFGHHLEKFWPRRYVVLILVALLPPAYWLSALWPGWHGVVLLMIGGTIWGITGPLIQEMTNSRVGTERRATMLSLQSFGVRLTFIPISVVAGWLSEDHDIAAALLFLPLPVLLIGLPAFLIFARRSER